MRPIVGEVLVDVARVVSGSRIIVAEPGPDPDTALAIIKLALVLKKYPSLQLRSIVEEWDSTRIVRELY